MPKSPTSAPAKDVHSRLEAAEVAHRRAAADVAKVERPKIAAALEALNAPAVLDLDRQMRGFHADIAHAEAKHQANNIHMAHTAARRFFQATLAQLDHAIALSAGDGGEG